MIFSVTRKLSFLPCFARHSSSNLLISSSRFLFFFSTSAATKKSSYEIPFVVQYLISSTGLSPEKAIKASKQISHIKTPSKPDAVLKFLKQIGLSDACIRNAVSRKPNLLCSKVEKTLRPKMQVLQQAGFSEAEIARMIAENPFFFHRNVQTKIEFFRGLFGSKVNIFKALINNTHLLCSSLDKKIMPNISFLRACGLSKDQVKHLVKYNPRLITRKLDSIKSIVERAQELGFAPGSGMFHLALSSICHTSRGTLDGKVKVMRSFGWSEAEISLAILKAPNILFLSETNIKAKVDFLVEKEGCELSYVIARPMLLCYSFEKRLIPRCHVLQLLRSKGLLKTKCGLFYCMKLTNKEFVQKFILPYQVEMPELIQVSLTLRASQAVHLRLNSGNNTASISTRDLHQLCSPLDEEATLQIS